MIQGISLFFQPFMDKLSDTFQSYPLLSTYYTTIVRWVFVVLAFYIILRAILSLLRSKNPSEIWAYLSLPGDQFRPLRHWENIIGRAKSADVILDVVTVSRNHGTLVRNEQGQWRYSDLKSKSGSHINGEKVYRSMPVELGDTITVGGVPCVLLPPSLEEEERNKAIREKVSRPFSPWSSLIALTIFQILTCVQLIASMGRDFSFNALLSFAIFTLIMWTYCIVLRSLGRTFFEMETILFFLCTLNLAIVSSSDPQATLKQLITIIMGMALFLVLCGYMRNLNRGLKVRFFLSVGGVLLLLINLVFGQSEFGAVNWIEVGGYHMQPSELVKIALIFIGSATLEELYEKKNLTLFMGFSSFCLIALAVMNDFGTAAIFFVTFLVISFLRSGEFSKLILIVGATFLTGLLAIRFVPHISSRFATWLHAWDFPDAGGFQQVRGMSGAASGGLIGVGACDGWIKTIFAADTDLVFTLLAEEWGLIIALLAVLSLITLGIFAVISIGSGRSTFYTICACSATSLIIFQSSLNVLGSVDILPFTGVTLPFISNGGTSMIASWGLIAFLKAADTRPGASLAVKPAVLKQDDVIIREDFQ